MSKFEVGDKVRLLNTDYAWFEVGGVYEVSDLWPDGGFYLTHPDDGDLLFYDDEADIAYASALEDQVGGDHYKTLAIQPMTYSMANNLNACQHTAIKYITRAYLKGDFEEQVDKAIHTLQLWKELEAKKHV